MPSDAQHSSSLSRRSGHVVVCGVGGLGLRTVEQLHAAGADVVVVDSGAGGDRSVTDRLLAGWEVPRIAGRPRDALVEAGAERAAAVVVVADDDLLATEIALLMHAVAPGVRLVVRLGNPAVGRALADVLGSENVLEVASLAAPSVVEACLGRQAHTVVLAGSEFVVAEMVADRDATLRELYGELAPIAVAGPEPVVCPGRDHPVRAGDRVTAIGTADEFAAHGVEDVVPLARTHHQHLVGARFRGMSRAIEVAEHGGRPGLRGVLRALFAEIDRPLRATLLILGTVFVISVIVLQASYVKPTGEGMSLIDAAYFTVETIATVGYGDFNFAEQAVGLRVFAIGLMVLGVVLAAIWFALLTELVVSRRVVRSLERLRIGSMRGHVILIGLGAVGLRVLEGLLAAGKRAVIIERDLANRHIAQARALGVPIVAGDATDTDVLASVNLRSAAAVAVLTSNDLVNIEAALAVRDQLGERWPEVPVVLRVFDRELCDAVEDGLGFRYVRSTQALAAPYFVGAALGLDVLNTFYVDSSPFMVGRLSVAPGGGLDGLAMGELSARTRVVAIHRAAEPGGEPTRVLEHPPRRGTRFGAGDEAYLVGPYEELLAVLRRDGLAPGAAARPTIPERAPADG
ncbi:MAG: Calcium-gated potassium channel mthK [Pseudonocardia sp.]|nr:Calcium-gated potassium channel mthK [Pseudonocardia sp.]